MGNTPFFACIRFFILPYSAPDYKGFSAKERTGARKITPPWWRHGGVWLWKKPHTHEKRDLLGSGFTAYFFRETAAAETRATAARAVAMPTTSLAPVSGFSGVVSATGVSSMGRGLSEKTMVLGISRVFRT